jgi:hypothetical protein
LQLGIIVLTINNQVHLSAITNTIKDSYLGIESEDYVTLYSNRIKANEDLQIVTDEVWAAVAKTRKTKLNLTLLLLLELIKTVGLETS